jgi:hypothetical protein
MGKALDKAREFKAESLREVYRFWLGFLEKLILLLLATIVIPFLIEKTEMSSAIRTFWLLLCSGLFVTIIFLGIKLSKLSINSEGGDR